MFPLLYIPVINDYVFKHTGISWEWAVVFIEAFLWFCGAEVCPSPCSPPLLPVRQVTNHPTQTVLQMGQASRPAPPGHEGRHRGFRGPRGPRLLPLLHRLVQRRRQREAEREGLSAVRLIVFAGDMKDLSMRVREKRDFPRLSHRETERGEGDSFTHNQRCLYHREGGNFLVTFFLFNPLFLPG